jgi:hypothetical protein
MTAAGCRLVATVTCAVVTTMAATSAADETKDKEPKQIEQEPEEVQQAPDWTIAAGLEASLPGVSPSGIGSGALGMGGPTFLVERRVGEAAALVGRVHGGYTRGHSENRVDGGDPAAQYGYADDGTSVGVGGALGVRWLLTPDAPLLFSMLALVEAGWRESSDDSAFGSSNGQLWQLGAALGVGLDRELVSGLGLRLDVAIVEAGYYRAHSDVTFDDGVGEQHQSQESAGWFGGFALRPTFALRYSF